MMSAAILGTGSALPSRAVSTSELVGSLFPGADPAPIAARIGIERRHWLANGETAAGLGAQALSRALEAACLKPTELRRLIFVSSTGGDQMIPATANGVADALGLEQGFDGFDVSNACAGFLTGFDLAARSIATGLGPVGVVAVETFSRQISPKGRRAYLVLGDGAAAAVLGPAVAGGGVLASVLGSSASLRGRMKMEHPGAAGGRGYHDFDAGSDQITATALDLIESSVHAALDVAHLGLADIDWVLPHQPNGEIFALLTARLGVPAEKLVPVYPEHGSLGCVAVPLSLDRLFRGRSIRAGQRVLMTAVGSGTVHGAIVYRVPG